MADSVDSWCLIESDPAVFTELISEYGCEGVQVEEIWSLHPQSFQDKAPVHGLVFLFKWVQENEQTGKVVRDEERLQKIFFAKQVINNACATQAILNILLNCNHPDVQLGKTLTEFKEFCQSFDPYNRGLSLSNSAHIRTVHNSFARQTFFEMDAEHEESDDVVYHFIGYIPIDGRIYELDGLKEGPIDLGAIEPDQPWTSVVAPIIEKRMQKYCNGEIHFNLMAIISDRQRLYQRQIQELLEGSCNNEEVQSECTYLQSLIEAEVEKRKRYKIENMRRKHNYLPFIVELMKALGEKKLLLPIYECAKFRALEQEAKKAAMQKPTRKK